MNKTNRAVNRVILLVVGLLLVVLGAAAITVMVWPVAADLWTRNGELARGWLDEAAQASTIGDTMVSWIAVGVLAVILLAVVLLVVVIARLGGRRSRAIVRSSGQENPLGRVTVKESFVSDALQRSFGDRDDILFASVTAHEIRREPVMQVSVSPRQNTSPRLLVEDVDRLVTNLTTLTGRDVPTYISVHSGFRTRLAQDRRRLG